MPESASGGGLDLIPLNFPLGCGPGPDPPQFPPLGVGLEGGLLWGGLLLGAVGLLLGGCLLCGVPPTWEGCLLLGGCLLWEVPPSWGVVYQNALRQTPREQIHTQL